MIHQLGALFSRVYLRYMPNAFVFAILLTLITGFGSYIWLEASLFEIIKSWYHGFFDLISFAMQIVLIIITGFSIALSPAVKKGIDALSKHIKTPTQVYFLVVFIGMILSLISFGWLVITSVLARELALRVKGINYPFLIACVYFSFNSWVLGLSSSIPLLLNSENNFLIENDVLSDIIPTSYTLQSSLNIAMIFLLVIVAPCVMFLLRPKSSENKELKDLLVSSESYNKQTIKEEAASLNLPYRTLSDSLNNSVLLQMIVVLMGLSYIIFHFSTKGLDLNFNIMIFIFLIIGMLLHKTPARYVISMKRSSSNISGYLISISILCGNHGDYDLYRLRRSIRGSDGIDSNAGYLSIFCLFNRRNCQLCHPFCRRRICGYRTQFNKCYHGDWGRITSRKNYFNDSSSLLIYSLRRELKQYVATFLSINCDAYYG